MLNKFVLLFDMGYVSNLDLIHIEPHLVFATQD